MSSRTALFACADNALQKNTRHGKKQTKSKMRKSQIQGQKKCINSSFPAGIRDSLPVS
jgi:hypothetical protein